LRSDNTYTYWVKDPRSDRERYMRVAPMALRSPSQNHFALRRVPRGEAEGLTEWRLDAQSSTHSKKASVRRGVATNLHLIPVGATNI
jgi:hypothetical protein